MRPLVLVLVLAACSGDPLVDTTPRPDYPCGVTGVSCGHGMCCDEDYVCGFQGSSCPAGACCWNGRGISGSPWAPDNTNLDPLGSRRRKPQREEPKP